MTKFPDVVSAPAFVGSTGNTVPAGLGTTYWVDTVNGSDGDDGKSPTFNGSSGPKQTVAGVFAVLASHDVVYLNGDIREEVVAPLGVFGVKLIGNVAGQTRHSTSGGVAVDGNGVSWREPASGATTGGALLTLIEQGWEIRNILFVPKSDATAIRLKRAEDGVTPDASHARIVGCKIIGGSIATQIGIEDVGGCHHVLIAECEITTVQSGLKNTSTAIANPLRWRVERNFFYDATTHLDMPFTQSIVKDNVFDEATTNVDTSGGAGENFILDNYFSDDTGNISNANGYTGDATDVWRNFAQTGASSTVGVPA